MPGAASLGAARDDPAPVSALKVLLLAGLVGCVVGLKALGGGH
ncbi:hypothetical protein [Actinomyces sp. W5033]